MSMTLWHLFSAGGFFMWPILFCSVLALAIAVWQAASLSAFHRRSRGFFGFLGSGGKVGSGDMGGLGPESLEGPNPMRELEIAEERVQLEFDKTSKPLEFLSALGGIAPLLGFLGTVSGMIGAFQTIAAADKVSVKLVAGGIAEAMITTGFGLCVAIPCMFFESAFRYYLSRRANLATEALSEAMRSAERKVSATDSAQRTDTPNEER